MFLNKICFWTKKLLNSKYKDHFKTSKYLRKYFEHLENFGQSSKIVFVKPSTRSESRVLRPNTYVL